MTLADLTLEIAKELIAKSGVREWQDPETRLAIMESAVEMAAYLWSGGPPPDPEEEEPVAASKLLIQEMDDTPPQILFRDVTDFSPTAANDLRKGTPTAVQFNFESVPNAAARQSTKFDLGENRAPQYHPRLVAEIGATPTASQTIDCYIAPSSSATAGTGNAGAITGADGAYAGYSSNLTASLKQLEYVGSFVVTAQATTTNQVIECTGDYFPKERYGSLVLVNNSGATMHSDAAEIHLVLDPVTPEQQ